MADHRLQVLGDAEAVARRGAELIAEAARDAVAASRGFAMAASGGHTPWAMYGQLEEQDVPWAKTEIFQVDERIAPAGSEERNLTHLIAAFSIGAQGSLRPMPVGDGEAGAERYAAQIPEAFELVHLGLGPDGHTASLVPGDPVLDVTDRKVAVTCGEYQGTHRMTLTYPVLNAADRVWVLSAGAGKRTMVAECLAAAARGDDPPPRPIIGVRPTDGELVWYLDNAAAGPTA